MKKNKRSIGVSCIILLLLCGVFCKYMHGENRYRLEVTQVGNGGYGYKIYEGGRAIIIQPFIPVVPGKRAFQTKQDARSVGNLVVRRIEAGEEFAISKDDLQNLGITY